MLKERLRRKALENAERVIEREGGVVVSELEYMTLKAFREMVEGFPNGLIYKNEIGFKYIFEPLGDSEKATIFASLKQVERLFEDVNDCPCGILEDVKKCLTYVDPTL